MASTFCIFLTFQWNAVGSQLLHGEPEARNFSRRKREDLTSILLRFSLFKIAQDREKNDFRIFGLPSFNCFQTPTEEFETIRKNDSHSQFTALIE